MSSGAFIQQGAVTSAPGVPAGTTDHRMAHFIQGLGRRDLGYLRREKRFRAFLRNGCGLPAALLGIEEQGAEGILVNGTTTPRELTAGEILPLLIVVTLDGPREFEARFEFLSTGLAPLLVITGTRAPSLAGAVGILLWPHNWEQGFTERLRWLTDVLIARDRTEQRRRLRTLPRRSWSLRLLAQGRERQLLENLLAARAVRYYLVPVWRDARPLAAPLEAGATVLPIPTRGFDYGLDRWVAVFTDWRTYELRQAATLDDFSIGVDEPLARDWPAGALVAPARHCRILERRRVARFSPEAAEYLVEAEPMGETMPEPLPNPETWLGYQVCPFPAGWRPDAEDSISHKWVRLDNETGEVEFDIHSVEPVFAREAVFLLQGRERIDLFQRWLFELAGRLTPFWLAGDGLEISLAEPVAAGGVVLAVEPMDYERSLAGSPARSHLELETTAGLVVRRRIIDAQTRPDGVEELTLDQALPAAVSNETLRRAAWCELVRLDSDDLELRWFDDESLEAALPVVALP